MAPCSFKDLQMSLAAHLMDAQCAACPVSFMLTGPVPTLHQAVLHESGTAAGTGRLCQLPAFLQGPVEGPAAAEGQQVFQQGAAAPPLTAQLQAQGGRQGQGQSAGDWQWGSQGEARIRRRGGHQTKGQWLARLYRVKQLAAARALGWNRIELLLCGAARCA